ncbi:hypothetical protein GCM10009801_23000 [Streptomyces albiaxialis]|uniref:DNA primase/polymerase bifunctional N-terminal domain-containing protein n=1 Tax=Streptomyces albiaxialis TaxID=329523 RepID=A0ABP5HCD0_9ACTN
MQWLSAAADNPEECRERWAADPRSPYALPTGRLFDVVAIEKRLGVETFDQLVRHGMPLGPVMADWAASMVGFFLPSGSRESFTHMLKNEAAGSLEYRYLDKGSVVVVPGPMPLGGERFAWLHAPVRRPEVTLGRTAAVAAMLVAASVVVSRADRYGQGYTGGGSESEAPHAC